MYVVLQCWIFPSLEQVDYSGHPTVEPKNEGGVLATMHHHDEYLQALKGAVTKK